MISMIGLEVTAKHEMRELRKRKEQSNDSTTEQSQSPRKKATKVESPTKEAAPKSPDNQGSPQSSKTVEVGATISLEGFGGVVETNEGKKTTLKELLEKSKAGVVSFTYPKASTPVCK